MYIKTFDSIEEMIAERRKIQKASFKELVDWMKVTSSRFPTSEEEKELQARTEDSFKYESYGFKFKGRIIRSSKVDWVFELECDNKYRIYLGSNFHPGCDTNYAGEKIDVNKTEKVLATLLLLASDESLAREGRRLRGFYFWNFFTKAWADERGFEGFFRVID
jgi:hypothetical protein